MQYITVTCMVYADETCLIYQVGARSIGKCSWLAQSLPRPQQKSATYLHLLDVWMLPVEKCKKKKNKPKLEPVQYSIIFN